MKDLLIIIQIVIGAIIIFSILLQGRGAGLGSSLGGQGEAYRSKRGVEKILSYLSTFLIIIFLILSIVILLAK